MKEAREQQTMIDQLNSHILAQAAEIDRLQTVAADEREACAKIAETVKPKSFYIPESVAAAEAIRSRGLQTKPNLLADCREMIADLCDDNNLPYPVELLHRIGVALGETYEN